MLWGLHAASREIDFWRRQTDLIPDRSIRADARHALDRKRPHLYGAALFSTLPRRRHLGLLRSLVTYEIILEFLDNMNERAVYVGPENGRQLHLALVDALNPGGPTYDYYRHHPWNEDGGYLAKLVDACREGCSSLRHYSQVRPLVLREATRAQVLAINHIPDARQRDAELLRWTVREFPDEQMVSWFELAGAATASLTIHMLLALAAGGELTPEWVARAQSAYFPGLSVIATMLDSYVDQADDLTLGEHSYITHYPSSELATRRLTYLISKCLWEISRLPGGGRHSAIGTCMIAMYLSSDSARSPDWKRTSRDIASAGGPLTQVPVPILRIWRRWYGLRSA